MPTFRKVVGVRLDVYNASGTLVSQVSSAIERVEIAEVADRGADEATFRISNYLGQYANVFDLNQELRFYVQLQGDPSLTHVWTGLIETMETERDQLNRSVIRLQANDFVFRVMGDQEVSYAYVATDAGTAVKDLLTNYAVEIDTSLLAPVGTSVTILANGQSLLEAVKEIARRANCTFYGDKDKRLHFEPRGSVSSGVTVTYAKVAKLRPQKHRPEANVVRVWGGDTVVKGASNEPAVSSMFTVTTSTRKTAVFRSSKSRVTKISLWTDPTLLTSNDDLVVRIQADNGSGSPTDINDQSFDLARKVLSKDKMTTAGWTDFAVSDNTVGAGVNYHLIVEASGSTGQKVGLDGSGNLLYRVYHPAPIIVERSDDSSISTYRRIVKTIRRRQIDSSAEAAELADSELARTAYARWEVEMDVIDTGLAAVPIGQTVTMSLTDDGLSGAYSLMKRRTVYDAAEGGYAVVMGATQYDLPQTMVSAIGSLAARLTKVEDGLIGKNNAFLTDLFRALADSFKLNDSVAATTATPGSYTVGPDAAEAEFGFSDFE